MLVSQKVSEFYIKLCFGVSTLFARSKLQLILFFYALSYFTRLPIPTYIVFDKNEFHKANAYLPIVGMLVAVSMTITFYFCQLMFSNPVSLILMIAGSILLTGALHEDGFADCCDGLGGGYDASQRLKIMKDSQIGSYGGIGLIILFFLKFSLLLELSEMGLSTLFISLLIAQTLSRYGALCLMQTMPYVRLEKEGKVQELAKKLNNAYFTLGSLFCLPVLLLLATKSALLVVIISVVAGLLLRALFNKTLGGYTGDCLGFTQQFLELTLLLLLSVVLVT
jgi:adenosylcobinamide-GDP ribazoletransferase